MISNLADALISMNGTVCNNSLPIVRLNYTRNFLLTLAEDFWLNLLLKGFMKLGSDVSIIYEYIP